MNVSSYIFQSPYSSQVQIGKPDPNAKEQTATQDAPTQVDATLKKAQSFSTTQESEVKPTLSQSNSLDLYV